MRSARAKLHPWAAWGGLGGFTNISLDSILSAMPRTPGSKNATNPTVTLSADDRRRLADARRARGLTQSDLAATLGVAAAYVGHLEIGYRSPSRATLEKWASAVGFSAEVDLRVRLKREKA